MIIKLKKFGTILTSRSIGKEAYFAFQPLLRQIKRDENLEIDFEGVNALSPSWGDEFLTPLYREYGHRLFLKKSDNLSIIETVNLLEDINKIKFAIK